MDHQWTGRNSSSLQPPPTPHRETLASPPAIAGMASPPRRFLFDLNVAQEEPDEWDEPEEVVEEERTVPDAAEEEAVEEVVELIVEEEEEEPMEEVTMEEVEQEEVAEEEVTMGEEERTLAAAVAAEMGEEEDREGRKKRKDYEVFVGGLPLDAAAEDVKRALAEAGEVEEVRLTRDPADPKLNRGFAFVRFAAAWEARWAVNDLRTATVLDPNNALYSHHGGCGNLLMYSS